MELRRRHLDPMRLVQLLRVIRPRAQLPLLRVIRPKAQLPLLRVTRPKAQLPLQLVLIRATLVLQGLLRRLIMLHLKNILARDPILNHQLVMILRLHKLFRRASYTDHLRPRLSLQVMILGLPAYLPMCPKFYTKTVAPARNLLTQDISILPSGLN